MNKKRLIRLIIAILVLAPVVFFVAKDIIQRRTREVQAVDPLEILYNGTTTPDPVFTYTNMLPGDEVEEEIQVKNNLSSGAFNVSVDGIMTEETAEFADILEIIITEVGGSDIYGGTLGFKTLQNFLDELPMDLGSFPAGSDKSFRIKVKFPSSSGNEYQLAKVVFNLKFETFITIELPPECEHLQGSIVNVVEGTDASEYLHGSSEGDLIIAKGGNDRIDASSSGDCVLGGEGNDHIRSESGDDVVLGGPGNDKIDSGSGNDRVWGGEGNDNIDSGSGNDIVYGEAGEDHLSAGAGNDEVWGGSENDTIRGFSGNDKLYGEGGNDNIQAGSGNDLLDGGPDHDVLNGNSGIDTCLNGETLTFCEL